MWRRFLASNGDTKRTKVHLPRFVLLFQKCMAWPFEWKGISYQTKLTSHSNLYIFSENYLLRPLALYLSENNCLKLNDFKFEVLLRSYEIFFIGISRQENWEFTSVVFDCVTAYLYSTSTFISLAAKPSQIFYWGWLQTDAWLMFNCLYAAETRKIEATGQRKKPKGGDVCICSVVCSVCFIEDVYTFMYIFHTPILTLCLICSLPVV